MQWKEKVALNIEMNVLRKDLGSIGEGFLTVVWEWGDTQNIVTNYLTEC